MSLSPRTGKIIGWGAVVFLLLVGIANRSDGSSARIDRDTFDGDWPFAASTAVLRCELFDRGGRRFRALTAEIGGVRYALNGDGVLDYADLDPLWLEDTRPYHGPKVSLSDVMRTARELCE